ncbi:unnamed protein product, partial [Meganyctiphanes norvegica]
GPVLNIGKEVVNESVQCIDMKEVLSAMQTKFCQLPAVHVENRNSPKIRIIHCKRYLKSPLWKEFLRWTTINDDADIMKEIGKENEIHTIKNMTLSSSSTSSLLTSSLLTSSSLTSSSLMISTGELLKTITIRSPNVVIEKVDWDHKTVAQKMQYLKDYEKKYKNKNSNKRKIEESARESYLNGKITFHTDANNSSNYDVIVEIESSKSAHKKLKPPTIKFKLNRKETHNETGSKLKKAKDGINKQLSGKSDEPQPLHTVTKGKKVPC